MTKTVRELKEQMKLIDLVIEIADARIPMSGRNPDLDSLAANKVRLLILGKKDLADEAVTNEWLAYFREQGLNPIAVDLRRNADLKMLNSVIRESCKAKIERDIRRGIMNRPIRALVAGIPNVGKSTFINSFSGSSSVKTGNKRGGIDGYPRSSVAEIRRSRRRGEDRPHRFDSGCYHEYRGTVPCSHQET